MSDKVSSAVLVKAGEFEVRSFPYPSITEDSMIVKIEMTGVCGSDIRVYEGQTFSPEHAIDLPIILGHENVGRIIELGEKAAAKLDVHGEVLKEGDRIVWYPLIPCERCHYCRLVPQSKHLCMKPWIYGWVNCEKPENKPWIFGGYGEYVYIRMGTYVWKTPPEIPLEALAMLDTLVSVRGVEKAVAPYPSMNEGFSIMDTVLILGDGPIGICAAAKAKVCGAGDVIMVGKHWSRLELAEEFGVDLSLNVGEAGLDGVKKEVLERTEGVGADVVVDCTGEPNSLVEGIELVRRGGTFVEIGCILHKGYTFIEPALHITVKDIRIIGQYYSPPQQYERDLKLLKSKRFPFEKMVTHKFPIEETEEAVRTHLTREAVKTVIAPK